jgi:hypothetical protein
VLMDAKESSREAPERTPATRLEISSGYPRTMRLRLSILALAIVLALGGCGGDSGSSDGGGNGDEGQTSSARDSFENQSYADAKAYPVMVSTELVVGDNRFVVGLLDDKDAPLAEPKIGMAIDFYDITGAEPKKTKTVPMDWVWIEEGLRGYYIGNASFKEPGEYGVEIQLSGAGVEEELRAMTVVSEQSTTPPIGERPPATETATATAAKEIAKISTDTSPEPRFYKYTIAQALDRGRPSVVVFATPKFCTSAVCAPTLDRVQEVAERFPDSKATFVHVEPYEIDALPEEFVPTPAMTEWKLPTEPWVFVMDSEGKVSAKFEGVMGQSELIAALKEGAR